MNKRIRQRTRSPGNAAATTGATKVNAPSRAKASQTTNASLPAEVHLEPTGERYLPSMNGLIELEHLHRYALASRLVAGMDILDVASGEGYGSNILARTARTVAGVDVSADAVRHASQTYAAAKNLTFTEGSAAALPIPSGSKDAVISFETIEHHDQHDEMISEIVRVLRPDGFLIISSPNKLIYSDAANYDNPYHVKELYLEEFQDLLSRYFSFTEIYAQATTSGSVVFRYGTAPYASFEGLSAADRDFGSVSEARLDPVYFLAVCSNSKNARPQLNQSICLHQSINVIDELERSAKNQVSQNVAENAFKEIEARTFNRGVEDVVRDMGLSGISRGLYRGTLELDAGNEKWSGWACRIDDGAPAPMVLIGNQEASALVETGHSRQDIVETFSTPSSYLSGFKFAVAEVGHLNTEDIRAVAIDPHRGAFELDVYRL